MWNLYKYSFAIMTSSCYATPKVVGSQNQFIQIDFPKIEKKKELQKINWNFKMSGIRLVVVVVCVFYLFSLRNMLLWKYIWYYLMCLLSRMAKAIADAILRLSLDDSPSNLAAATLLHILTCDVSLVGFY